MVTKFVHRRSDILSGFRQMRRSIPGVMAGFNELHQAAMAPGQISTKHKELIAIGIAVAGNCGGCIALHVHDAVKAGANRQEIEEAVGVAILMGGGPAAIAGTEALEALDQFLANNGRDTAGLSL